MSQTASKKAAWVGTGLALACLAALGGAGGSQSQEPAPGILPASLPPQLVQVPGPKLPAEQLPPVPESPAEEVLPPPAILVPPDSGGVPMLPLSCGTGGTSTTAPRPSPQMLKEMKQYIEGTVDPMTTLDLILGRPRLLVFKETPKRVQIEGSERDAAATVSVVSPKEITLVGRRSGTAVLNLWFPDLKDPNKEKIFSYLIRVGPDLALRQQWDSTYQALAKQINCNFPDSHICLALVGNKLMVSGQARDVVEATQILNILRSNAPGGPRGLRTGTAGPITLTSSTTEVGLAGTSTQTVQQPISNMQAAGGPNVINQLRIPGEQQVMLKVTVAEVNRAAARSIGANFTITSKHGVQLFTNNTGSLSTTSNSTTSSGSNSASGGAASGIAAGASSLANLATNISGGEVALLIDALRSLDLARSLAEPNLTTLNGKTAQFTAGGSFPIPVVTGATSLGLQGVTFQPFGISLNFTPVITDKDRIHLDVRADISTRDNTQTATVGSTSVPGLSSRTFHTNVELRDGETMAVAGLIQNNFGSDATRVPFFGDLPLVGRLFAFDRTSAADQELVVLVTPVLVHPLDPKERAQLPGSDIFEPGDVEFYLLGRLESRRTQDYRSPARTDIRRMMRYHHCEDVYIIGPQGPSDGH